MATANQNGYLQAGALPSPGGLGAGAFYLQSYSAHQALPGNCSSFPSACQGFLPIRQYHPGRLFPFGNCLLTHVLQRAFHGDMSDRAQTERTWAPFSGDRILSLFGMVSELQGYGLGHGHLAARAIQLLALCSAVLRFVVADRV